jgi:hypothetical protein
MLLRRRIYKINFNTKVLNTHICNFDIFSVDFDRLKLFILDTNTYTNIAAACFGIVPSSGSSAPSSKT